MASITTSQRPARRGPQARPSMRVSRRRCEQVVEPARVVTEHIALANPDPASRDGDDAARLERLDGPVGRLGPAGDAEIGAAGAQRVENRVGAALELAP